MKIGDKVKFKHLPTAYGTSKPGTHTLILDYGKIDYYGLENFKLDILGLTFTVEEYSSEYLEYDDQKANLEDNDFVKLDSFTTYNFKSSDFTIVEENKMELTHKFNVGDKVRFMQKLHGFNGPNSEHPTKIKDFSQVYTIRRQIDPNETPGKICYGLQSPLTTYMYQEIDLELVSKVKPKLGEKVIKYELNDNEFEFNTVILKTRKNTSCVDLVDKVSSDNVLIEFVDIRQLANKLNQIADFLEGKDND